jgi:diguanylate cyclase (GGDEF)-like protein
LRSILWLGLALCLALGIGSFVVVVERVVALSDARGAHRGRFFEAIEAHDMRLVAVLVQDGGRADRAAYERGRSEESAAAVRLAASLHATDLDALRDELGRLDTEIAAWRATPDRSHLEAVRTAHSAVGAALHARLDRARQGYQSQIEVTVGAGLLLLCLGTAFAIAMVVWILRRTATPLERLSRIALNGESFPAPEHAGVREVDTLAWALHELDLAVRDREERLAEAHTEAVELAKFGEHVQQVVDESELHESLAQRLLLVSDAHAVTALVRSDSSGRLQIARSTRPTDKLQLPILGEPMRCRAVRTLKPVTGDGGSPTACRCALAPEGGAYLCEPMIAAGELVGVLNLQADWKGHFTSRIQGRVHGSLAFGATALASLRLLAATRERAMRDALTGAYNRSFLNEFLDKHLSLAERRSCGLGILAIDLDHFKRLNDTHGHAAGDRALIATVEALHREVRTSDAVIRHGGEELIVVLVDTNLEGAADAAERIRTAIESIVLTVDDRPVPVRASIGVAAFPDHGRDQQTLLVAADRALYQAKEAGRNRVITAERRDGPGFDLPSIPN